jgi:hypothetical protein
MWTQTSEAQAEGEVRRLWMWDVSENVTR